MPELKQWQLPLMHKVLITGAGKVGSLIASLLFGSGDYDVYLADLDFTGQDIKRLLATQPAIKTITIDVKDTKKIVNFLMQNTIVAVISSLPYFLNSHIATAAKTAAVHYFDLTEDTTVTQFIKDLSVDAKSAFVPQCGIAPGFIGIVANSLIQEFDDCIRAELRVGALPQRVNNALHYSLTWSTEGLINEYCNKCISIEHRKLTVVQPLEGLERIQCDGSEYEAFNTSGGLGNLAELYSGKIQFLNYKTIRYPGHCEKVRFMMHDLQLNADRPILQTILERALPKTYQDLVILYVTVAGLSNNVLIEKSYFKKIYPMIIHGLEWSAIQLSTAAGMCTVVDLILSQTPQLRGFVSQEAFNLSDILSNRFGIYF